MGNVTGCTSLTRRSFLQGASFIAATGMLAAACRPSAAPPSPQVTGERLVTFMSTGNADEQKMFQEAIAAIKPKMDAHRIRIEWQPDPGGGWNKIMAMFAADQAFDIQRIDDDRVYLLAVENKIHQLDAWMLDHRMNKNDYYPSAFTTIAVEGYQFCLNPAGGANCVYYNVDLFEKAGIRAPTSWARAWSWEEFWENVRKLTKRSGNTTEVYAIGFPPNVSTPTGYGNGATAFTDDETRCGFNSPLVHEVIDPFVKAVKDGFAVPPDLNRLELFNASRLAMTWESMGFDRRISRTIRWDLMPWPKTKKYAMTENYDRTFVIAKSAKDPEAAFLGLKALCEKEASDVWATYRFGIPYLKASAEGPILNDPNKPPKNKNIWFETFGDVNGHPVDVPTPRGPIGEEWKEAFTSELFNSALAGQITTQQFLDQAAQRVNNEIAKWQWRKGRGMELLQRGGALTSPGRRFLSSAR